VVVEEILLDSCGKKLRAVETLVKKIIAFRSLSMVVFE
jgi:hypothetical protein